MQQYKTSTVLLLALLLSGCGLKGPLYMPKTEKAAKTETSAALNPISSATSTASATEQ